MEGVVWGTIAGMAFGLFQATNRRANRDVDPYRATFTVIVVSFIVLSLIAVAIEEPARVLQAGAGTLLIFALAGMVHFFLGWTFLALAQQRAGAARTGVISGTAPLFGTAIAFLFIGEVVRPIALLGVLLVVGGVGILASSQTRSAAATGASPASGFVFATLTALSWGIGPTLARYGLQDVPYPISGVSVGMGAAALAYGIALTVRRVRGRAGPPLPPANRRLLGVAGLLVATGIGTQWTALDLAPVAIVLALNQLAVPVVLLAAPVIVGTPGERLTRLSWLGAALTVVGTIVIIASRA